MESSNPNSLDMFSNHRLSFSFDICIHEDIRKYPDSPQVGDNDKEFEFHLGNLTNMTTADELFFKGKMLPSSQMHRALKVEKMLTSHERRPLSIQPEQIDNDKRASINWIFDDDEVDPSPRLPKCSVLLKELLKLGKRPSGLPSSRFSSSSSSSSFSSSSSGRSSSSSKGKPTTEILWKDHRKGRVRYKGKDAKKNKKDENERLTTSNMRIMPVSNVPVSIHPRKTNALPFIYQSRHP